MRYLADDVGPGTLGPRCIGFAAAGRRAFARRRGEDQGEFPDFTPELGDNSLGGRFADSGKSRELFDVLLFNGAGDLADRPDHGPQRLPHADAVDRAKDIEELAVDCREEADCAGSEPAHHRPTFDIEHGVERDDLAQLRLNCSARVLADQELDLEGLDQKRGDLVRNRLKSAPDSREHDGNRPFTSA